MNNIVVSWKSSNRKTTIDFNVESEYRSFLKRQRKQFGFTSFELEVVTSMTVPILDIVTIMEL